MSGNHGTIGAAIGCFGGFRFYADCWNLRTIREVRGGGSAGSVDGSNSLCDSAIRFRSFSQFGRTHLAPLVSQKHPGSISAN
jgi:hypothetical protein